MKKRLLRFLQKISSKVLFHKIENELADIRLSCWQMSKHLEQMHERELRDLILRSQPDSILRYGFSVYSQNDEDGIIQYIFAKIGVHNANFIEFGVSPTENNSLYLLTQGSKGVWVDGNTKKYQNQVRSDRLKLVDTFVTRDNVNSIVADGCKFIGVDPGQLDLISMDLDGNDYYFVQKILESGYHPKVFCVEYNGKFRDINFKIQYNEQHLWSGDDYFGCSLMGYCELFRQCYTLLVCNITGANAFFIRNDLKEHFSILDPSVLYQPPRYYFSSMYKGHPSSNRFINDTN